MTLTPTVFPGAMSKARLPSFVPRRSRTSVPLQRAALPHLSFTAAMRAPVTTTTPGTMLSVALGTTVNGCAAGVASVLPSASRARTWKVCAPRASAGTVRGDVQSANGAASTRHSKVAPGSLVNPNVGVVSIVCAGGTEASVVSGAVASIVNVWVAGVASRLPAWSVAHTEKVCAPSARAGVVYGEEQETIAAASTWHSNVANSPGTAKPKVGVESFPGDGGTALIVVSGAEVSTVKALEAGVASTLPASSVARTWNVCAPPASAGEVIGEAQGANAPPSMLHWNVEVSFAEKRNSGVESFVCAGGPRSIVVCGAAVSTVSARLAGVGSALPASSLARTWNVCAPSSSTAVVCGDAQAVNAPASTAHSKVAPGSLVNSKVGVESFVSPGPVEMEVSGAAESTKVAVTERASLIVTVHTAAPEQSPLQPAKAEPAAGVAESATTVSAAIDSEQSFPQSIPFGSLATAPAPEPVLDTASGKRFEVKVAVTDLSSPSVTTHSPEPVQSPVQPVKVDSSSGTARRVTSAP